MSDLNLIENSIINRIQALLDAKHWSIYKLAKVSKLSYSSLNNIFRRNTCPSIPTLEKICNGLNISLSQFFEYKQNPLQNDVLSEDEQDLLYAYRSLSKRDKEILTASLHGLCKR